MKNDAKLRLRMERVLILAASGVRLAEAALAEPSFTNWRQAAFALSEAARQIPADIYPLLDLNADD